MAQITANPSAMRAYEKATGDMAQDLCDCVKPLGEALDAFRASEGWSEFLSDVPPLDIDLAAGGGRLRRLGAWVGSVGGAFELIDSEGKIVKAEELWIGLLAPRLQDPGRPPALVRDGDRWILNGSDEADHIQVINRDGAYVARVGRLGTDGRLAYDEVPLTDEQVGNLVIRTGDGNDVVEVPPSARLRVTIWTGAGDDMVGAASENPAFRVGGGGDERIFLGGGDDVSAGGAGRDETYGGDGRDVIEGQDGGDRSVGGDGFDTLYGGRGGDRLEGGRGDDYLEGGRGDDVLRGLTGDDVLSGGRGEDHLQGGAGDDRLFGGRGTDRVDGGHGRDVSTGGGRDTVEGAEQLITIELTGEPGAQAIVTPKPDWMTDAEYEAWLERIDSDLELVRSTPQGRAGLEALDDASGDSDHNWLPFFDSDRHVVVVPYGETESIADGPDGRPYSVADWMAVGGGSESLPGNYASPPGNAVDGDALVSYGGAHSTASDDRPPVLSLIHELSHSHDQISGGTEGGDFTEIFLDAEGNEIGHNVAPRAELNSVGYDLDGDGDIDTRPSAGDRDHPSQLTENSVRDDLGWPRRRAYGTPPEGTDDVRVEIDE